MEWTGGRRAIRGVGRTLLVAAGSSAGGLVLLAACTSLLSLATGGGTAAMLDFLCYWLAPLLIAPFLVIALAIPVVAFPLAALLRRLGLESRRAYLCWGAAAGLALAPLLASAAGPIAPAGIVYGALAGLLFHRLFRRAAAET